MIEIFRNWINKNKRNGAVYTSKTIQDFFNYLEDEKYKLSK